MTRKKETHKSQISFDNRLADSWALIEPDLTESSLERQVADDGSAAGVVGHDRPADVVLGVEIESRHGDIDLKEFTQLSLYFNGFFLFAEEETRHCRRLVESLRPARLDKGNGTGGGNKLPQIESGNTLPLGSVPPLPGLELARG